MKQTLPGRIFPLYIGMLMVVVSSVTLYSSAAFRAFSYDQKERELIVGAKIIQALISEYAFTDRGSAAEAAVRALGTAESLRVTLIFPDGTVAADSDEDPLVMENHIGRPEIVRALSGSTGVSVRYSGTLSMKMMYVAVPVYLGGQVNGIVRVSSPMADINAPLSELFLRSAVTALLVAAVTAGMSYILVKRIADPLNALRMAAEKYAQGDFDVRVTVERPEELRMLAVTMNGMADQLRQRIRTITEQRNKLEGILSNMVEAVFLLDGSLRIRSMNTAALRLFGNGAEHHEDKTLLEYVKNVELHEFAERTLSSVSGIEAELILYRDRPIHLQAHGTVLGTPDRPDVLLVLHDVSRLVQLEEVRKDFVANVSHELRTPVTSIRGFVETLKEGAVDEPDTARRFLDIIERHTDRLSAIIDDLLSLSRLEHGRESVRLEEADIRRIVLNAIELCVPRAQEKEIVITQELPVSSVTARMNTILVEQAVLNLLDNAVKYSDRGSRVRISVTVDNAWVHIAVIDSGCGIPARDHDRIFERFYRVDKGRSRVLGGTGLGLAIVKHIMKIHHGEVVVESAPGRGSTFTLNLPV